MNIFSNIRRDAALRNATVYAQWFGVLSAISFILIRVVWIAAYDDSNKDFRKYKIAVRLLDMIFFPLCPFSMETPPSSRRWRVSFGISLFWCYARTVIDFIFSTPGLAQRDGSAAVAVFFASFIGLTLFFTMAGSMLVRGEPEDFYSCRSRALFYTAYTFSLAGGGRGRPFDPPYTCTISPLWFLRPGQVFALGWWFRASQCVEIAEMFSALAALAYFVAYWAGHEYVFTRTLGGPGVELMPRVTTGLALRDESIGQGEGRIMLS
ncbi:hypothetical protein F4813DRAFT_102502 [Daldinia decipiens]|uniref:uncharacterized protein n=1 Tax=Daldinia decipiens TaxID=326647 RepID=UPI0020C44C0A|nr:uncharacterized protein F4813DRAFT_102502 [Daldinia decipiens]KAI1662212.1 hypothetical protein F4813DRAFT_102502 [Daldinia decipiens]